MLNTYELLTISEKLYWVCTKCQTCAEVYSQKSHTVQTLGVCYFPCLWIHDLCHDFDQHSQSCHEILQSTPTVHSIPRCSQCHIYSLFHDGVCVQTGCLQIQGKRLTDSSFQNAYFIDLQMMRQISHYNWKKKNVIKVMLSRLHDNLNTSFVLFIIFISFLPFLTCYQLNRHHVLKSIPTIISLLDYFYFSFHFWITLAQQLWIYIWPHFVFILLPHNNHDLCFVHSLYRTTLATLGTVLISSLSSAAW